MTGLLSGIVLPLCPQTDFFVSTLAAPLDAGGPTWTAVNTGLTSLDVRVLVIDPANVATVYAASRGVFKTTDGGANWANAGLSDSPVVALAINHFTPNVLYAGIHLESFCAYYQRRLFKSVDGGATWEVLEPNINGCDHIDSLVLDPVEPNTLYLADYDHVSGDTWAPLMKSTDSGASWQPPSFNPPFASLAIDPLQPATLYAGTFDFAYFGYQGWDYRNGVLKSTDGGANWSTTGLANTGVNVLAIDPLHSATLYAATSSFSDYPGRPNNFRGLFKSTDGGTSWFARNNGLSNLIGNVSSVSAIVIDPDNLNVIYVGSSGGVNTSGGVFKSIDGGASWNRFSEGLTNLDIRTLVLAPGNPNTLYAGTSGGVFKIIDPVPATTNAIDDTEFFVRQQYIDFLGREPDPLGAEWVSLINNCVPIEPSCDRIHVSEAFFKSPEFQERGYFAYRFYSASFGRKPDFAEFMPDLQQVSGFLTVEQLQAAKAAFVNDFVTRPAFANKYNSLGNQSFVDTLLSTADVALSNGQALIDALNNGTQTRSQVLRQIAESNEVYQKYYNQAFVVMQYFGYLRRDPDILYLDWINVLDANPSDSRHMIDGFVNSIEYRQRFGQ